MVQATQHPLGHDPALLRWLDGARLRCILIERAVRPRPMILFQKSEDDPFAVGFIQHDDVVQALAAESTDPALDEGVLPGTLWCDEHFLDAQVSDALPEDRAVAAVTVADQVRWRLVKGAATSADCHSAEREVIGRVRGASGFSFSGFCERIANAPSTPTASSKTKNSHSGCLHYLLTGQARFAHPLDSVSI